MNSTGKKVVGGKRTNKIKIQPYPKTALVPFITPNSFKTEVKRKVYVNVYQEQKRKCQSNWITRIYFPKSKCKYRKWRKKSIASSLPELQEAWHTYTPCVWRRPCE